MIFFLCGLIWDFLKIWVMCIVVVFIMWEMSLFELGSVFWVCKVFVILFKVVVLRKGM